MFGGGGGGGATDDNMAHAHCMLGNYNYKHAQYAIFVGFPRQQSLHEHTSLLHYTYIACLVIILTHVSVLRYPYVCFKVLFKVRLLVYRIR